MFDSYELCSECLAYNCFGCFLDLCFKLRNAASSNYVRQAEWIGRHANKGIFTYIL